MALYAKTIEEVLFLAEKSAIVSHNHPEGIKGAQAVILSVYYIFTDNLYPIPLIFNS